MSETDIDQEVKILRERWRENLDQLYLLYQVCQKMVTIRDTDTLLVEIASHAFRILRSEAGSILLFNPETGMLDFSIVTGERSDKIKKLNIQLKLGEGIAGWVAKTGEPLIVPDAGSDSRFKKDIDSLTGFTTRNILCVPMKVQNIIIGVIETFNKHGASGFDERDQDFLMTIASLAAAAIEKARANELALRAREYQAAIIESMPGGYIGVNARGKITHFNSRAIQILTLSRPVIGEKYPDVFVSEAQITALLRDALELGKVKHRGDIQIGRSKSMPKRIGYSTLVVRRRNGQIIGAGMVFQELSEKGQ